jgi:hypothetical protein
LGHSDPKVTLAVYTRVLDSEIDDAGITLTSMINRAHSLEMSELKVKHIERGIPAKQN